MAIALLISKVFKPLYQKILAMMTRMMLKIIIEVIIVFMAGKICVPLFSKRILMKIKESPPRNARRKRIGAGCTSFSASLAHMLPKG